MPSQGFQFEKWTGEIDGVVDTENSTITVVMANNRTITANFTAPGGLYSVSVEASPAAGGFVTIETPCGSLTSDNTQPVVTTECLPRSDVTLIAEPAEGYRFRGWKGDLHGPHDNVTLTVDSPKSITARFAKPTPFPWQWVVLGVGVFVAAAAVFVRLMDSRTKGKNKAEVKARIVPSVSNGVGSEFTSRRFAVW